jgi:hypothetical protein
MPMNKEQILTEAMALEPTEREALAEALLLSLDDIDREAIDAAWLDEARRRDEAYTRGETIASPLDQAVQRVLSRKRP